MGVRRCCSDRGCGMEMRKSFVSLTVIHRIPMCATSIALTVDKEYIIGVIYNPVIDEMFEATHLSGSKLNGKPIQVSTVQKLQNACISTECGSDRSKEKVEWVLDNLAAVLRNNAQCIRMMGSCALNMAYVASGRMDVLYERGPHAWDMAAGVLIVRQAGGVVCGGCLRGEQTFELTGRTLLSFTPTLREELGIAFHQK